MSPTHPPAGDPGATVAAPGADPPPSMLSGLLLHRRDLAASAAEHTAHDLPGANLLWQGVDSVENRIRELFPDTWARCYPDWVAADATRLHTADTPQPDTCRICATVTRHNPALRPAS